jgi:hypothetical protein
MNYRIAMLAVVLCATLSAAAFAETPYAPQPEDTLKTMLTITWSRGPNVPQGFQDSNGGVLGHVLVTACGFCAGHNNDRKPGKYPRGFLNKTWAIDLANEKAGWLPLPDFPGAPRQALYAACVGDAVYFWGGFSYSAPFCHTDGYRLSKAGADWKWEPLPPLPWPCSSGGTCALGTKIYLFGGADYDADKFYTATDRAGKLNRLGAQLLVFDTNTPAAGWKKLTECPGTPRFVEAFAALDGKLYAIGGATGTPYGTVVDNWMYDPATDKWSRLRDLPIASGNFPSGNIVFQDRYLVLGGGYQYDHVANPDGSVRNPYGKPHKFQDKGDYYNDVFVYDTRTGEFGRATSMPLNNNMSMLTVHNGTFMSLGGETGTGVVEGEFYGHHPDLFLKGKIEAK